MFIKNNSLYSHSLILKTKLIYLIIIMTNPIYDCVINKKTTQKPIWFMRQAGRYLPEFRKIRKLNPNFINLCLNKKSIS